MKYIKRITSIMILPEGEPIFCETGTTISITDDAAGEYLKISQCHEELKSGEFCITSDEWPAIREGIDMMVNEIAKHEKISITD